MNILIIDTCEETILKLSILSKVFDNLNLKHLLDYDESLEYYTSTSIDYLIVDFSLNNNNMFVDEVLKRNPQQKIITLSNILKCSDKNGCDHCINNYNKRRLFKPFSVIEIVKVLKDFDNPCLYSNQFECGNLINIMDDILRTYTHHEYNKETKTIYSLKDNYSTTSDTLDIIALLENQDIKFEIEDQTQIKILN
jgi:hypothetical protein